MTIPNFLVAGAARGGTTALVEGLRLHPDVFLTQPKEPHYFAFHGQKLDFQGPGDDEWVNRVCVTDPDVYLNLFSGPGANKAARGEGSVTTLYYAERAVPEILRINPEMKVVLILREPVDRAFSSYTYLKLRGVETEETFEGALKREEERKAANWHHMWHYTAMSSYANDLKILRDGLGADNVGVWFYDRLESEYAEVLAEVAEFLDLPQYADPPAMTRVNASGTARSKTAQGTIRWATENQAVRSALKKVIPFQLRERIRSSVLRSEDVPDDVAAELAPVFAGDLAELSTMVTGPRPGWLQGPATI